MKLKFEMCSKCVRLQSQDDKKVFVNLENCKSILKNTFRWGSLNSKQPKFKKRKKKFKNYHAMSQKILESQRWVALGVVVH